MQRELFLVVHESQLEKRIHQLPDGIARVGRQLDCEIRLAHTSVSRLHAEFINCNDQVLLRDLKSFNGTFINKRQIDDAESINLGDRIRFGGVGCDVLGTIESARRIAEEALAASTERWNDLPVPATALASNLTVAEKRVFDQMIIGKREADIAAYLNNSSHTVHNHIREIYRVFKVNNRPEFMALFVTTNSTITVADPPPPSQSKARRPGER